MKIADLPENEAERLQALLDYDILDTAEEQDFDDLTELASSICQKPIALVSLIDSERQWFKSHHGLDAKETPRDFAFCAHAILDDNVFEICDSTQDDRFFDNPLVIEAPDVIYYAGAPLKSSSGHNIGTLCVIDSKPGKLSDAQKRQLRLIANQVIAQLELRKANRIKAELLKELKVSADRLSQQNQELYQFSHRVAHDLNSPLSNIQSFVELSLKDIDKKEYKKATIKYNYIKNASSKAMTLIDDLLDLTRADLSRNRFQIINFEQQLSEVVEHINNTLDGHTVDISYSINTFGDFICEPIRLEQVLYNLLSNSVKYSDPKKSNAFAKIVIDGSTTGITIKVQDNGLGIPEKDRNKIFDTFTRFHTDAAPGSGIGMTIVKKHIEALGGTIELVNNSALTEFIIKIPSSEIETGH